MKEFEIWRDTGYTQLKEDAELLGIATGETFFEACENFRSEKFPSGLPFARNPDKSLKLFDGQPWYWMCKLYDNEADAIKATLVSREDAKRKFKVKRRR